MSDADADDTLFAVVDSSECAPCFSPFLSRPRVGDGDGDDDDDIGGLASHYLSFEKSYPSLAKLVAMFANEFTWWNTSYLSDYFAWAIVALFIAVFFFFVDPAEGLQVDIYDFAYNKEEVDDQLVPSATFLFPVTFIVPLGCMCIAQIWVRSLHDLHNLLKSLVEAFLVVILFYAMLSRFGEPRPTAYTDCDPIPGPSGNVYDFTCAGSYPKENELLSFFSGHAAMPMALFTVIDLYLLGKCNPFVNGGLFLIFILLLPGPLWSIWVAYTRVRDNQHHWWNVVLGLVGGVFSGVVAYLLNYPNPFSSDPNAGQPRLRGRKRGPRHLSAVFTGPLNHTIDPAYSILPRGVTLAMQGVSEVMEEDVQ